MRPTPLQHASHGACAGARVMPGVRPLYCVTGILKCLRAGYSQQKTVAGGERGVV